MCLFTSMIFILIQIKFDDDINNDELLERKGEKHKKRPKKKVAHHWYCIAMQSQIFFSLKEALQQDTREYISSLVTKHFPKTKKSQLDWEKHVMSNVLIRASPAVLIFFTSKFSYLLFCNPIHETETRTTNGQGTPTNSKPLGPIIMMSHISETEQQSDHIYYTLFCRCTHSLADALLSSHSKQIGQLC